jgi:hypothetical protein
MEAGLIALWQDGLRAPTVRTDHARDGMGLAA